MTHYISCMVYISSGYSFYGCIYIRPPARQPQLFNTNHYTHDVGVGCEVSYTKICRLSLLPEMSGTNSCAGLRHKTWSVDPAMINYYVANCGVVIFTPVKGWRGHA